ncbi:MAG: chemotaxis protein CheW [bacterium]
MSESADRPGENVAGEADAANCAGKYMTFKLTNECYGLGILDVREIIRLMDITPIPRVAGHISGVINLRGSVIPIMDLRVRFGMPRTEPTDQTVIIVVQHRGRDGGVTMGILVDEVMEVLDIAAGQIAPPPELGDSEAFADFVLGVGKVESRVVFLLDIGKVIHSPEVLEIAGART